MPAFMFTTWTHCILPNTQDRTKLPSWALSSTAATATTASSFSFSTFIPDAAVLSRLLFLPPSSPPPAAPPFFSLPSSFKASEDGQVVSSSCVTTCLVSWCACSCQYLCLLWIACFSPWLDTNVAHKLLLTLMWTNVGGPEIKMIKGTK